MELIVGLLIEQTNRSKKKRGEWNIDKILLHPHSRDTHTKRKYRINDGYR